MSLFGERLRFSASTIIRTTKSNRCRFRVEEAKSHKVAQVVVLFPHGLVDSSAIQEGRHEVKRGKDRVPISQTDLALALCHRALTIMCLTCAAQPSQ